MAIELSVKSEILSKKIGVKQQVILDIPALPDVIFGAFTVTKVVRIGEDDLTIGDFIIGGVIEDKRQKSYISFNGSTTRLSQQLLPDKGGTGTVTTLKLRLVDKNDELTAMFQPGNIIEDLLGERARVFLNMVGGAHPEDSIEILDGNIDDYKFGAGFVDLIISFGEQKKRVDVLTSVATDLDGAINDTTTTVILQDSAEDLILPADILTSFILIDEEYIQFTGVSGQTLTGVTRGALGSTAVAHSDEAGAKSIYRLNEQSMPLALKVMLSDGGKNFAEDIEATAVNVMSATKTVQNSIRFLNEDVESFYGLVIGDFISTSLSVIPANNFTDRTIVGFGQDSTGSWVVVSGSDITNEVTTSMVVSLKSKYNTLPDSAGCGMTPQQVDVVRHEEINDTFSASFPLQDFLIDETKNAQDFINKEIFLPSGLYQVPRARVSVNYAVPPLAGLDTITLTKKNVHNLSKLKINRSRNENFYNRVVYHFNYDPVAGRTRSSLLRTSNASKNRIKVSNKTLRITAPGVNEVSRALLNNQASRYLNRYQFGAESLKSVEIGYNEGLKMEIGDTAIFGEPDMKISDSTSGTRNFKARLFEIVNKSMSLKSGEFEITILDTGFDLNARYGTFSPSSKILTGSTQSELLLTNVFGITEEGNHASRWERYIGEDVIIRDPDFTVSEIATIKSVSATKNNVVDLESALTITPLDGYIMESPPYDQTTDLWKTLHTYMTPVVSVISGSDNFTFVVGPGDIAKFVVGNPVQLRNDAYTALSPDSEILTVDTGTNTIKVETDLGFTPNNTHKVELIGFSDDNGNPYRIL